MSTETVELSAQQCWDLLGEGGVGRIAFCGPSGPQIYPVTFVVDDQTLVFRTSAYSVLGSALHGQPVAFEVDRLDVEQRRGWSVVVQGQADAVDDADEIAHLAHGADPVPWVSGTRRLYVRVRPLQVTGRRLD